MIKTGNWLLFRVFLFALTLAGHAEAQFNVEDMRFRDACANARSEIVIGGVGDFLMHDALQAQSYAAGTFEGLWSSVLPVLQQADVLYGNLETPIAAGVTAGGRVVNDPGMVFDDVVYTGYPTFNTNPRLATDIANSQFDVVSTANNHALDRGRIGIDLSIEALRSAGLAFSGTRMSTEPEAPFYTLVRKGGWNLAFIACTFSTNGIADSADQVLYCFQDREILLQTVTQLSQTPGVDAVIVTPHWGDTEYVHTPDQRNVTLGRALINAGATAVIGTHPHVVQPWEKHTTPDGREGLIAYSTGNFVSGQGAWTKRMSLGVFIGLSRDRSGHVWTNGVRYHPMYMLSGPRTLISLPETSEYDYVWNKFYELVGEDRLLRAGERLITNYECH